MTGTISSDFILKFSKYTTKVILPFAASKKYRLKHHYNTQDRKKNTANSKSKFLFIYWILSWERYGKIAIAITNLIQSLKVCIVWSTGWGHLWKWRPWSTCYHAAIRTFRTSLTRGTTLCEQLTLLISNHLLKKSSKTQRSTRNVMINARRCSVFLKD